RMPQELFPGPGSTVANHAARIARDLPVSAVENGDIDAVRRSIESEVAQGRVGLVEVYRSRSKASARPEVTLFVAGETTGLPHGLPRPADRLASIVASGSSEGYAPEPLEGGGELVRGGAAIRDSSGR